MSPESKKYFHRLLGDMNGNATVDALDKSQVLAAQGATCSAENDVNGDGFVNVTDTLLVTRAFGRKLKGGLFRDDWKLWCVCLKHLLFFNPNPQAQVYRAGDE